MDECALLSKCPSYTSKSLLVIVSNEIKKIYWIVLRKHGRKEVGIGVMEGGKYTLGLNEIWL